MDQRPIVGHALPGKPVASQPRPRAAPATRCTNTAKAGSAAHHQPSGACPLAITVPQAASLAVGAVRQVPVVRGGQIVVGEIMNVTLSADHRIVDGAVAAQYLAELRKLLEAPLGLLV